MPPRFQHFRARGIKFVFKYDSQSPEHLHIYARHLTTPQDAAVTFFAGPGQWNEENQRFETYSNTHGLLWYWLKENADVMIISCFRIWRRGRMSSKKIKLEDLGDYEMDPTMAAKAERMIEIADAELEEIRVNFRWGRRQVNLVKQAAGLMGIPYQIYIKETIYRQALKDVRESQSAR